jgi:carboxypeptidase T
MIRPMLFNKGNVLVLVASVLSFLFPPTAQAEDHDPYAKIRVRVSERSEIARLHQLGVEVEHSGKPGKDGITCIARGKVLERLRGEGIPFEIIVPDLERFYAKRLAQGPANALGFGYGSMGGYYTLDEIRQQLDSLRHVYPGVVGRRDSIGASLQGRPIWAVRMTANPDNASQRPRVLYFAMQHACETMGMMTLLYFMWYLAEHYGQDPEATYLLENRDLWFIPIVNVDGYEANHRMSPSGGGMRRKNMHGATFDGDDYGVDLNRNWGAEWGYDDLGSSPNPLNWDFRGTGPFSEPETQVVRDFCKGKAFRFVLEYHTYWNATFGVPGYIATENADSLLFRAYIRELTRDNHYSNGMSTGAYPTNGYASDWLYENSPVPGRTFPFLTEIGNDGDGYWAPTNRILPLASENLKANLFSAWAGGAYAKLQTSTVLDSSADGDLEPGERFSIQLTFRNFGQDPTTGTEVALTSSAMQLAGLSEVVGPLAAHADTTISITGRVAPGAPIGVPANIVVTVKPGGLVEQRDTITCLVGKGIQIFADEAESGTKNWSCPQERWGRSSISHSGQWSFTDSPSGNYPLITNSTMTLFTPVHVPEEATAVRLRFWSRWDIEPGFDFGQVLISSNNGASWTNVYGRHASYYNAMCYTGWQPEWVEEDIDISGTAGRDILLRFALSSNFEYNADGWYIDDISIRSISPANLSFAHDVRITRQSLDSVRISARVENPLSHPLKVTATLSTGAGGFIDSLSLKDDGLHGDSASADGLWGYQYVPRKDDTIHVTIRTDDTTAGTSRSLIDAAAIIFTRRPVIGVSLATINLGLVSGSLSSRDTTFTVSNTGFAADLIHIRIDSGNVSPSTALAVRPTLFPLSGQASRTCTVGVKPGLLAARVVFSARIVVDSDSGYAQRHFEIPFRFMVSTVEAIADERGLPTVYALEQNYPNPFNPSTTITFALPKASVVTLSVYDMLGREVSALVNERRDAGVHEVQFDGGKLSSGMYVYRLRAGDYVETKRMLLLR